MLTQMGQPKMSLSKKVKNGVKKAVSWIADFEQTAAELAINKGYDYVICGHIHQPQQRVVTTAEGQVTYLNSGDWIENLTALEYNNHQWELYCFIEHKNYTMDADTDDDADELHAVNIDELLKNIIS